MALAKALGKDDVSALNEALKAASAEELVMPGDDGCTPLKTAVMGSKYECAKALIAVSGTLGAPVTELAIWERIQADKLPTKDADGEDVEPKDVEAEEYQTELAAELLPEVETADALFTIKAIIKIGIYVGDRAALEEVDKQFDTQVGDRFGWGVCLMPAGDVYAGEYGPGGLREGLGCLKTKSGTAYAGGWQGGKRHGMGSMTYADGGVYNGNWAYGKRHGQGTFTYPNGDAYNGTWHAGVKHGAGKYTTKGEAAIYSGTWKWGDVQGSKVTFTSADNAAYYGKFDKYGRPTGAGAFAFTNGVSVAGRYAAEAVEEGEEGETAVVTPAVWYGAECGKTGPNTDGELTADLTTVKPTLNVVIAGAPASGKGTQCEKIAAAFGLIHLSTGDMLREAAADADNELGQIAKEKMEAGELVPDDLIIGLVAQRLDSAECREKGWLLDGFPRTPYQATEMEKYFLIPNKCVLLEVPDAVLVGRVTGRRLDPETGTIYHMETKLPYKLDEEGNPAVDEEGNKVVDEEVMGRLTQRADDTEEALGQRLVTFHQNVETIAATFGDISQKVDGNRAPDEVWADIEAFLNA